MTFYRRLRLRYGLRWAKWYPTPSLDFWVLLGVVLAYCVASYVDDLGDRAAKWEASHKVVLHCMNQAHQGGNLGMVLDGKLIGIECTKLSDKAYEGVKL